MPYNNDWWDYLKARQDSYLEHSAKGSVWENKKYIGKTANGTYIYPQSVMKSWSSYREALQNRGTRKSASQMGSKYKSQNGSSSSKSLFSPRGKTAGRGTYAGKSSIRAGENQIPTSANKHIGTPAGTGRQLFTPLGKPATNNGSRTQISLNTPAASQNTNRDMADREMQAREYASNGRTTTPNVDSGSGRDKIVPPKAPTESYGGAGNDRISTRTQITDRAGGAANAVGNWLGDRAKDISNAAGAANNAMSGWLGDRARDIGNAAGAAGRAIGGTYNRITGELGRAIGLEQLQNLQDTRERANQAAATSAAARAAYNERQGGPHEDTYRNIRDRATQSNVEAARNAQEAQNAYDQTLLGRLGGAANAFGRAVTSAPGAIANGARQLFDSAGNRITNNDFITDRIEQAKGLGNRAVSAVQDAWNNRPELSDIANAGRNVIDNTGRNVSNAYDRLTGKELGETWNRIAGGDDHFNRQDIGNVATMARNAIGNAAGAVGNGARQLFNAAGDRAASIASNAPNVLNTVTGNDALEMARYWQERANAGDPQAQNVANSYMEEYLNSPAGRVTNLPGSIASAASQIPGMLNGAAQNVGNAVNTAGNRVSEWADNGQRALNEWAANGQQALNELATNGQNRINQNLAEQQFEKAQSNYNDALARNDHEAMSRYSQEMNDYYRRLSELRNGR